MIPLCHNINLGSVGVELVVVGGEEETQGGKKEVAKAQSMRWAGKGQGDAYNWHQRDSQTGTRGKQEGEGREDFGRIEITATVQCEGKTGVEMEALTAASVAGLTVYDMCKAVDKGMWIGDLRVVRKEGGKSGTWVEGRSVGENVAGALSRE